ncbi:MAG: NAD(P)/FAD-dependent oxidoreductase [Patescibacteria group bacterium]|nr:NAD(P)/FAD-dependent oxidoreductase [Patescibacteria group bacterium]
MNNQKKILILGGGFGGVYSLINLHKKFHKNKNVKITLISKKNYFLFTPLLHEFSTGGISIDNLIEPIREIVKCCDYDFIHNEVKLIDLEKRKIHINNHILDYDYLIIALGSTTNFYNLPGAEKYSLTLKNIDDAIKLKNRIIENFEKSSIYKDEEEIKKMLTFVIVGGGATGVELSAEMSDYFFQTFSKIYPKELIEKTEIYLIEKGKELIPQFHQKLREKVREVLEKKKVKVLLEKGCLEIGEDYVKLDNNQIIKTKNIIWTAGVKPNLVEIIGNFDKDKRGAIITNEYLQISNYPEVFVIGDCSCFYQKEKPLPQLAQVAVSQANNVAYNIYAIINKKYLKKFIYKHKGDLLSLGKLYAVGEIKNIVIAGWWVWLLWKLVYLSKMISWRDRIKTLIDWIFNIFSPRDISEI